MSLSLRQLESVDLAADMFSVYRRLAREYQERLIAYKPRALGYSTMTMVSQRPSWFGQSKE